MRENFSIGISGMVSKITEVQTDKLTAGINIIQPLASKSLFWQAAYLTGTDAIGSLPFLFWIVESVSPRVLTVLTEDTEAAAEPYFAMCQAVERLGLESRCFNIGPNEPSYAAKHHNVNNYEDFSALLSEPGSQAALRFGAQSIDLLYLDLARLPADLSIWRDRLSPRCTVLLHGMSDPTLMDARESCQNQLGLEAIDFTLEHGKGVGLHLGAEAPNRLASLARLKLGDPGYSETQKVFFRLGKAHSNAYLARTERSQKNQQKKLISQLQTDLEAEQQINQSTQKKLNKLRSAYENRSHQIALSDSRHFDEITSLKQLLTEAQNERARALETLAEMTPKASDADLLKQQLAQLQEQMQQNQNRTEALQDTVERQDREMGKLVNLLKQNEDQNAQHESKINWLRGEVKRRSATAEEKTAEAETAQEALASTKAELAEKETDIETMKAAATKMQTRTNAQDAEIAAFEAQVARQTDELVALTRLFEAEKKRWQQDLEGQNERQMVLIELRNAEISMQRVGKSRLTRRDAPSRAGLPSTKAQIEAVRKSELFDANWYLETYPDVAESKMDPAQHYVLHGNLDGRDPGPNFKTMAYYLANRDVAQHGFNALVHHEMFGKSENRKLHKDQ